jgi:poly(A) polymerase
MEKMELRAAATEVVRDLHEAGHQAFFVGGCVRDLVMGVEPQDIDIATSATPEAVTALFPGSLLVGAAFGVVIVLRGGHMFEVATFRADHGYVDGRHPTAVSFTDAEGDVRRRDFTINGMLFDPETGAVVDCVGGRADIERHLVRAIGDPEARFGEDRLRMLRAVRFAARLGFSIDPATAAAIRTHAPAVTQVSWERIGQELERILTHTTRATALRLLDDLGLLAPILPEVVALKDVRQGKQHHPEGDAFDHTLLAVSFLRDASWPLVLGTLLHDIGKAPTLAERDGRITFYEHNVVGEQMALTVCTRLRQSRRVTETVTWLVRRHMGFLHVREMRRATLKRLMREEHFPLLLELYRVDALASGGDLAAYQFVTEAYAAFRNDTTASRPAPLVTGRDLIALGLPPGPEFGRILMAVEDERLEGRIRTRDEALALARRLVKPNG